MTKHECRMTKNCRHVVCHLIIRDSFEIRHSVFVILSTLVSISVHSWLLETQLRKKPEKREKMLTVSGMSTMRGGSKSATSNAKEIRCLIRLV
jgi:hypothetical protein